MHTFGVDWYHRVPPHVKEILHRLHSAGRKAYIVGGAVRDLWLGLEPKDYDVVSEASVEEIEQLFPKTIAVGKQFGIMVVLTDGGPVEVARFRADGAYTDNRHPDEVKFADPEADARRRDFTINALFYDPSREKVIDYVGGLKDLEAKRLTCVGEASKRFEEDALRMLRAIRFHTQLGPRKFTLDPQLIGSIRPLVDRIKNVSKERITQEMERVLLAVNPSIGLKDLIQMGLWESIFQCAPPSSALPELIDELADNHIRVFGMHPGLALPLAMMEAQIPGFEAEKAFVLSKVDKTALHWIAAFRTKLAAFDEVGLGEKKRILNDPVFPIGWSVYQTVDQAELPLLAHEWNEMGRLNPAPILKPDDLIELGVARGPILGKILQQIRDAQLDEKIASREEAEAMVRKSLESTIN